MKSFAEHIAEAVKHHPIVKHIAELTGKPPRADGMFRRQHRNALEAHMRSNGWQHKNPGSWHEWHKDGHVVETSDYAKSWHRYAVRTKADHEAHLKRQGF